MENMTDAVEETITSEVDAKSVIIVAVALAAVTAVAVWRFRSKRGSATVLEIVENAIPVD